MNQTWQSLFHVHHIAITYLKFPFIWWIWYSFHTILNKIIIFCKRSQKENYVIVTVRLAMKCYVTTVGQKSLSTIIIMILGVTQHQIKYHIIMTSSNGNIFRVTGVLCGEFTGHRWIPRTKASKTGLWCFLWFEPEPTVELTMETPVIWDTIALIMTSL